MFSYGKFFFFFPPYASLEFPIFHMSTRFIGYFCYTLRARYCNFFPPLLLLLLHFNISKCETWLRIIHENFRQVEYLSRIYVSWSEWKKEERKWKKKVALLWNTEARTALRVKPESRRGHTLCCGGWWKTKLPAGSLHFAHIVYRHECVTHARDARTLCENFDTP